MMPTPLTLVAGLLATSLTACTGDAAGQDRPTVATSFYPLEYVAERVAGEHATVINLTPPGVEPHDLSLSVKATAQLTDADLAVHFSGFQPAVDEAIASAELAQSVDAAEVLGNRPGADSTSRPVTLLEGDPHFWLDPRALAEVARAVRDRLVEIAPEHRDDLEENWAELEADLLQLDGRTAMALDDCRRRTVVSSHDAFGYFGYRYDLEFLSINGLTPEAEPSPAHLRQLQDLIRSEGITTVFSETLASPQLADTLADDLGLRTAVLDPVEGLSDETADEDYLSIMESNVEALVEANDCTGKPSG